MIPKQQKSFFVVERPQVNDKNAAHIIFSPIVNNTHKQNCSAPCFHLKTVLTLRIREQCSWPDPRNFLPTSRNTQKPSDRCSFQKARKTPDKQCENNSTPSGRHCSPFTFIINLCAQKQSGRYHNFFSFFRCTHKRNSNSANYCRFSGLINRGCAVGSSAFCG